MNSVDIIIIIVLILASALGIYWGIIRQVLAIVGLIAGIVLASRYGIDVAAALSSFIENDMLTRAIGFIIVMLVITSTVSLVATLLHRFVGLLFLGWLDHLAGGLLGLLQAALFCTVVLAALAAFPNQSLLPVLSNSRVAPVLMRMFDPVLQLLPDSLRVATTLLFEHP